MKKILILLFLLCFGLDAHAYYAKILTGANFLQGDKSTYQTGYLVSGSLGIRWDCGLGLEGEYAFRRNAVEKIHFFGQGFSRHGHFQTSSYMANLLWNVPLECPFGDLQPFFGAGIGYDFERKHASNSRIVFDQKWRHFSWQLMAGVAYPLFCNTEMTFEYKFHQGGRHFYNHSLGVGLIYDFEL